MSDTDKNISENRNSMWFVRTADSDIYGPVELEELQQWAEQGRIEPLNEISVDQENWISAAELPELEMNWMAELDDNKTFGPFNFHLTHELVQRGVISKDTTIRNRKTGETHTIESTEEETDANDISEQPHETDEPEVTPAEIEQEMPLSHEQEVPQDEDSLRTPERIEVKPAASNDIRDQLAETRKKLTKQRAINTAMQDNINKLQDDLRNSDAEKESIRNQMVELQDKLAASRSDVENTKARLQQLQEHYERIQAENQEQFEELDAIRAEAMEREQEFQKLLSMEAEKTDEKTSTLIQVLQTVAQDEDIKTGNIPEELLETNDPVQIADLQQTISNLRQQVEIERNHARQMEKLAGTSESAPSQKTLIGLLLAILTGIVILIIIALTGNKATAAPQAAPSEHDSAYLTAPLKSDIPDDLHAPRLGTASPSTPIATTAHAVTQAENLNLPPDNTTAAPTLNLTAVTWPDINLPRSKITHNNKFLRIVFSYGLFSKKTTLSPNAKIDLANLAKQLRPQLKDFTLIAEGHTDPTPISHPQASHINNFALGMARAEAVKNFLETTCRIPEGIIKTTSAGESDPPFSNTDIESAKKNRTVVFKLIPRQ